MELSERFMATLTDEQRAILREEQEHEALVRKVEEDAAKQAQKEFEAYIAERRAEEERQEQQAEYMRSLMM